MTGSKKKFSIDEIFEIFSKKEIDKSWSFSEYKPSDTSKWSHGYHRYPAKFIPQLVEKLLEKYINKDIAIINDPFFGSGTTIVSALSMGYKATGTDINKIAYLITKVKSTPINPSYLEKKICKLFDNLESSDNKKQLSLLNDNVKNNIEPYIPLKHLDRINYWFNEENKNELGQIFSLIKKENDKDIKDFFLVAFSHILKNCSIWLQGSTKPTRDYKKKPSSPISTLKKHLNKMKRGNQELYKVISPQIRENLNEYLNIKNCDATKQLCGNNSVDIIISSSPYVTSYEYADLHQLSTIWFDFAENLIEYRKKFIGTVYKNGENKDLKSIIANSIVNKMIEKKHTKIANEIKTFFSDMQKVFDENYRILRKGGRCCYVIGNTKLKRVDILNAEVFAESLQISGFHLDRIIKREIPSKILPQKRDEKTGQFAKSNIADTQAYPVEYIVIGLKE